VSQAPLFIALHAIGVALCLAFGPRRHPALCAALGFPVGLAVIVLLALALLVLGVPFAPWSLAAVAVLPVAAAVVALRRRPLERRAWIVAGWWTAGFAALCPVLTDLNLVLMTHDSHIFVNLGRAIAYRGELPSDVFALLDEWGVFQVVAQALVTVTAVDFLYALPVVLGLSFVPVFALTLWHGLAAQGAPVERRALLVALATLAVFSSAMVAFHLAYLHSNMGSAVYLFGYVVLFWLAEVEDEPAYLPVAFLCLIGLALMRTETPIVAVLFLALTVAQSHLPRRDLTRAMIAFTAVVGLWFEVLAWHVTSESAFLTPMRCRIVWGVLVLALGWWLVSDRPLVRRINAALPAIIAGLAALALAGAFAVEPDHMWLSAERWKDALTGVPHWGSFWYLVPLLALLALTAPPPRFRQAFVVGIPVFFAFVLLLALGRDPYFSRVDDSANRMTIHIVPLLVWYLALKVLPLAAPARTGAS
jgi:hypothetical protein